MTKVLVVDDDAVSRLMLSHILANENYEVSEAESAAQALESFADNPTSLVVCDYHMPGGSGLEIVEHFVAQSVPFILLTGVAEHEQLDDPRADLVSAYLTKPVSSHDLADAITSVMDAAKAST